MQTYRKLNFISMTGKKNKKKRKMLRIEIS